jgi:hypothetical protein
MVTGVFAVAPSTVTEIVVCTGAVTLVTLTSKYAVDWPGSRVIGGGAKNCRALGSPSVTSAVRPLAGAGLLSAIGRMCGSAA